MKEILEDYLNKEIKIINSDHILGRSSVYTLFKIEDNYFGIKYNGGGRTMKRYLPYNSIRQIVDNETGLLIYLHHNEVKRDTYKYFSDISERLDNIEKNLTILNDNLNSTKDIIKSESKNINHELINIQNSIGMLKIDLR